MKPKLNYFIIPAVVAVVAVLGSIVVTPQLGWYQTLSLPEIVPPDWVFIVAWTAIYLLISISALIVWNMPSRFGERFGVVMSLFALNGVLNLMWTLLFFGTHMIGTSLIEIVILEIVNIALFVLIFPTSRMAALLLLPYLLWVGFATYINYLVCVLNLTIA